MNNQEIIEKLNKMEKRVEELEKESCCLDYMEFEELKEKVEEIEEKIEEMERCTNMYDYDMERDNLWGWINEIKRTIDLLDGKLMELEENVNK